MLLLFFCLFWFGLWEYMYMCIVHYFSYYLPDSVIAICWGCVICFSYLCICFNPIKNHLWNLHSLAREQSLRPWCGSPDSKTLGYQRMPNPREYQLVRIPTKATTCTQDLASPSCQQHHVQDASSKQQTDTPSADRIPTSQNPAHQRKQEIPKPKTNSPPPIRSQAQVTPIQLTQHTGPNL